MRFNIITILLLFWVCLPVKSVVAQTASFPDVSLHSSLILQRGQELRCLTNRTGMDIAAIAAVNRFTNPAILRAGFRLDLPQPRYNVRSVDRETTLLAEAIRSGAAEYALKSINHTPAFLGSVLVYPVEDAPQFVSENACLTYPLVTIAYSSESIMRGKTLVIALETTAPTLCEAQYLGRTEPCYALDDRHYFVLMGISALENPGDYKLRLRFTTRELETSLILPFTVTDGAYGFQYINPPVALNALLDKDVMEGEEDYLQSWREIRTPQRLWTLPVGYPLTMQLPISADYGDRRSYGGMVDGYHSGVDYRAWTGLPVIAPADGIVILNERLLARGNAILIDHGWGLITGYWHLSSSKVKVGQYVARGEVIGEVGNTGLSTGSHLHWETWVNGISVDGKQWYDPRGFSSLTADLSQLIIDNP